MMTKNKLFILTLFCSAYMHAENPVYMQAGKLALQALDHIKIETPALSEAEKAALDKDIRKLKPVVVPLTEFEKKEICFDILSKYTDNKQISSIIDQDGIQELHVLCGETGSPKSNLLSKFKPVTTAGSAVLARKLIQPSSDVNQIEKTQAIIKELVQNPALLSALETELTQIKDTESLFLGFWKNEDALNQKAIREVYFPEQLKHLNNNPKALEALRAWHAVWHGFGFLSPMWFPHLFLYFVKEGVERHYAGQSLWPLIFKLPQGILFTFEAAIRDHMPVETPNAELDPIYQKAKELVHQSPLVPLFLPFFTIKDKYNLMRHTGMPSEAAIGILALYRLGYDAIWLYRAYQAANTLEFQQKISNHLHTKMNGVAQTLMSFKELNALVSNNQTLAKNLTLFDQLQKLCDRPYELSTATSQFMRIMSANTFKGKPTIFALRGRVLAAASLMPEIKNNLVPALEAVGELDACLAVAKNIKELENTNVHYCFVEFVPSDTPYIDIEDGWNPLVDPKAAVPLTLKMGPGTETPNALLTGPHGCGKSTAMESVAYSVLAAHAFGVSFATICKLSPFTKLRTYMDIKQNREEGLSTFMAEAQRVDKIKFELSALQPGERCLTVMDEVFKGTMEKEGAKRLYKFGKKVIEIPQNIGIFATHFVLPTTLEEESNGKLVNFHVGLEEPTPGAFSPTYQLIKGINRWWFDDKEKRERYINWLRDRLKSKTTAAA